MEQNEKILEVRNANDIVEVVSSYLPLTKKGKNYFGVCPFHEDTNPSMSVSREKQIYKCFSCGASGNVFQFVMNYEHIEFKEALALLAKKAGISLGFQVQSSNKYEKYYQMYLLAGKFYQNNLQSKIGFAAKEYLKSRGITEELMKEFQIGLAMKQSDTLVRLLTKKDYTLSEMERFGLSNGIHDLYIHRIMFPLFDTANRLVGFSGRIYESKSDSKYVNTKETPIFKKGEVLYHYYDAKEYVRKEKCVVVVEGFMDVIRLSAIGIRNTVALMGTALTKEQTLLLKRLSHHIYLCLDGDEAGQKAMLRIGEELQQKDVSLSVICLKDGLDPDEYVLKNGKDAFYALYHQAISFSDFKIQSLKSGKDFRSVEDVSAYLNQVLIEVQKEQDEIKKELILQKMASEFQINVEILRNKLQNLEKYSKIETLKKEPVKTKKENKYEKATKAIVNYMLMSKDAICYYEAHLNFLPIACYRHLASEILYYHHQNGSFVLADFMTTLEGKEELQKTLGELLSSNVEKIDSMAVFQEYICVIKGYSSNQEIKRLNELLRQEPNPTNKIKIAEEIRLIKLGVEKNDERNQNI